MEVTIMGMEVGAFIFAMGWFALALWGVYLGLRGIMAEAPPFHEGGHAPGAEGSFDPHMPSQQQGMTGTM
ncbi:MAG: hypothetical protein ACE5FN_11440 [Leptospirillia bacterium]